MRKTDSIEAALAKVRSDLEEGHDYIKLLQLSQALLERLQWEYDAGARLETIAWTERLVELDAAVEIAATRYTFFTSETSATG